MRIESNLGTTILAIRNNLVNELPIATEKALRMAGLDARNLVADRIQQRGESVNGKMVTKSNKADGVYSKGHKKTRDRRNFQTSFVDLTMDGDLMNTSQGWDLQSSDSKSAEVGFRSETQSDKAGYLEDYYGEIFSLTKEEEEIVVETFNSELEMAFLPKIS